MTRVLNSKSGVRAAVATALACTIAFAGSALADEAPVVLSEVSAPSATAPVSGTVVAPAVDRDEQRIRTLHDKLGITAAQEGLWGQLAQVMRTNDERIDDLASERHGRAATMTAVEDLRSYGTITEAHAAGLRAFVPAFESLYNSMSTTQKANADNVFRHEEGKAHKSAN